MDLTLLYTVLWKPGEVFRKFAAATRPEPFLFLGATVIIPLFGTYWDKAGLLIRYPKLLLFALVQGLFFAFLHPGLQALIVFLVSRFALHLRPIFPRLLSAFILCGLPHYISFGLYLAFGYPVTHFGLGGLFLSIRKTHPFLFGIFASVTPFFLWVVFLWRAALDQLLSSSEKQRAFLLGMLILYGLFSGGLVQMLAAALFTRFNPAP